MKTAGYLLIILGFIGAAYHTSLDELEVPLAGYLLFLVGGIAGVILVRTATRREATHEDRLSDDLEALEQSLGRLAAGTARLEEGKTSIDVYDLRQRVDDDLRSDLGAFADGRESIAHSFGLQSYADVMNHFAAGERYLNRVWSASTDGYINECHTYIAKAADQFDQAQSLFRGLVSDGR